jgi:hypothetical protein
VCEGDIIRADVYDPDIPYDWITLRLYFFVVDDPTLLHPLLRFDLVVSTLVSIGIKQFIRPKL